MKRTKFTIGLSGFNFLKGSLLFFREEAAIYNDHYKKFPERQSGIKSKKAALKLEKAASEVELLLRKISKDLKF